MSNLLSLPETLTIQTVQAEYARLAELLPEFDDSISFEAHNIANIDTAGLQLLVSLITKIQCDGKSFIWLNPSDALIKNAENLGLTDALQL
jgi:anti-anti-sigma regulatory factor